MQIKVTFIFLMRSLRKEDNAKCWQKVGNKPPRLLQVRRETGTDILESWPAFFPQIKYFIPEAQQFPSWVNMLEQFSPRTRSGCVCLLSTAWPGGGGVVGIWLCLLWFKQGTRCTLHKMETHRNSTEWHKHQTGGFQYMPLFKLKLHTTQTCSHRACHTYIQWCK